MVAKYFGLLLVLASFEVVSARGETCYVDRDSDSDDFWRDNDGYFTYCTHGCCGSYGSRHCCLDPKTAAIVGGVVGAIAFIALVATVIVVIVCCLRQQRRHAGQVMQPNTTTVAMGNMQSAPAYPSYPNQPYGVGYPPVQTANMAPGTTNNWQAPPDYKSVPPY